MRRVGVYGWGIVAPRSPNIEAFAKNLESSESWLQPFEGFGPNSFLVGYPDFDFSDYREWISTRFPPTRFSQLVSKMEPTALYAVGAFIQALGQNPGIESLLQELGPEAHVYLGVGLGAYPTVYEATLQLDRAQRIWDRFWAQPGRCHERCRYEEDPEAVRADLGDVPLDPSTIEDPDEREDAVRVWNAYWAAHSADLVEYLDELRGVEEVSVGGEVEAGKLKAMREKERSRVKLQERWGAPDPPWTHVSANVLWNIPNTPAAQVSMLGGITGFSYAPVAACATFGVCIKVAMDAIRQGDAKAVVVGATDPPPHALTVGAFNQGRVLAADGKLSKPLTGLRGTHVSGGSVVWIVGDKEFMEGKGFRPLGMEPVAVGVSSDAHHIITPSKEGPLAAIRAALREAGVSPEEMGSWDLHATATPGDYLEVENLRDVLPSEVLVTARKGTFGHGMSAGGGWELTAQYLGSERGTLFPTPLRKGELNAQITKVHDAFVYDTACPAPRRPMGKLSMGVGGVNACVISRPLEP
ncbi:MAG: beta-ketoacyl synthase [Gemmatimonadetes bacterium]|nr:beta-ketoacyl synthase [Gemmatimonadota bacterium]